MIWWLHTIRHSLQSGSTRTRRYIKLTQNPKRRLQYTNTRSQLSSIKESAIDKCKLKKSIITIYITSASTHTHVTSLQHRNRTDYRFSRANRTCGWLHNAIWLYQTSEGCGTHWDMTSILCDVKIFELNQWTNFLSSELKFSIKSWHSVSNVSGLTFHYHESQRSHAATWCDQL